MVAQNEPGKKTSQDVFRDELYLNPEERSDVAAKNILQNLLSTIQNTALQVVDDVDSEYLHDFRIAIRRSRSLLNQLPGLFPKRFTVRLKSGFKELGDLTSAVRDMDVMLLKFEDYQALLPDKLCPQLETIKVYIERDRANKHLRLCCYLKSQTYKRFIVQLQQFTKSPATRQSRMPNAQHPIGEFVDSQIWRCYQKALKQGEKITEQSAPEKLHELRKSCKKLRYLIEFGQSFHSRKTIKKAIRIMKNLQNILGEFQDLQVHMNYFANLKNRMAAEGMLSMDSVAAIDTVSDGLNQQQLKYRKKFQKRFDEFSDKHNQRIFASLFSQ